MRKVLSRPWTTLGLSVTTTAVHQVDIPYRLASEMLRDRTQRCCLGMWLRAARVSTANRGAGPGVF
jgi:hypothetical protein